MPLGGADDGRRTVMATKRKYTHVLFAVWGEYEEKDWRLVAAFSDSKAATKHRDAADFEHKRIAEIMRTRQMDDDYDWSDPPRVPFNKHDPKMNKRNNWDSGISYGIWKLNVIDKMPAPAGVEE
jgi:hypothetical protein